uniref:Uncharacterized protein n=1 Tax=Mus musculus TaxID=10090 RepID=Q3UU29_MOUSE|nr:unnamed protein product [Mus musculus]
METQDNTPCPFSERLFSGMFPKTLLGIPLCILPTMMLLDCSVTLHLPHLDRVTPLKAGAQIS